MLGDARIQPRLERLGVNRLGEIRLQNHKCLRALTEVIVGNADHGRLVHRRVLVKHLFQHARVHLEPAHHDHVLHAVDDEGVAVLVDVGDVARAQEAVDEHVAVVAPPVALHHLRPPEGQLARLAHRHHFRGVVLVHDHDVRARQRQADGARFVHAVKRVHRHHARAFRQAIALHQNGGGRLAEALLQLNRQRRAARNAQPQRVKIALLQGGRVQHRRVHGRHARQHRHLMLANGLDRLPQLKLGQHHDHAANPRRHVENDGVGEHVEKRQCAQNSLRRSARLGIDRRYLLRVDREAGVGQHRALGLARGAAGILQHRQIVVRVDLHRSRSAVVAHQRLESDVALVDDHLRLLATAEQAVKHALDRRQRPRQRADDKAPQPRALHHFADGRIEARHVEANHDVRLGILNLRGKLVSRVEGREIDYRPARLQDGVVGDHVLRAIRQEQAHLHALFHPQQLEPLGGMAHQVHHLAIGIGTAKKIEVGRIRRLAGGTFQQMMDRHCLELGIPGRSMTVVGQPGPLPCHLSHPFLFRIYRAE